MVRQGIISFHKKIFLLYSLNSAFVFRFQNDNSSEGIHLIILLLDLHCWMILVQFDMCACVLMEFLIFLTNIQLHYPDGFLFLLFLSCFLSANVLLMY